MMHNRQRSVANRQDALTTRFTIDSRGRIQYFKAPAQAHAKSADRISLAARWPESRTRETLKSDDAAAYTIAARQTSPTSGNEGFAVAGPRTQLQRRQRSSRWTAWLNLLHSSRTQRNQRYE